MARAAEDLGWMARMEALTATPVDDWDPQALARAHGTAARLVALARKLCAREADPFARPLPGSLSDRRLHDVVHLIATCDLPADTDAVPQTRADLDGVALGEAFLDLVREQAGPAVYMCRTVLHPSGSCLFTAGRAPVPTTCGRLLPLVHHLTDEDPCGSSRPGTAMDR